MRKIRLGNLNIYSPKRAADWRISVNLEVPGAPRPTPSASGNLSFSCTVPHPVGAVLYTRRKDRMSYSHEEFTIDLTQVTSNMPSAPVRISVCIVDCIITYIICHIQPQILHELELEFARHELLLVTAAQRGDMNLPEHDRSAFDELIRAFVNNARILVRNSSEGWQ